jgi:hypothetical protein
MTRCTRERSSPGKREKAAASASTLVRRGFLRQASLDSGSLERGQPCTHLSRERSDVGEGGGEGGDSGVGEGPSGDCERREADTGLRAAGAGQRAARAALLLKTGEGNRCQVGPHGTVLVGGVKPDFEFIQMSLNDFKPFQINSNFFRSKQGLPELKKYEIK